MLAGLISYPSGYDPQGQPGRRAGAPQPGAPEHGRPGLHHPGRVPAVLTGARCPPPRRSRRPSEDSAAPYFTSWLRQQLVDKYGAGEAFGGGLQVTSTLDLDLQNQVQQIAYDRTAGVGLNSAVVVLEQRHRRRRGDGRRLRLPDPAVQPGHPGPSPAGLLVQAVHPGDGARAGALARRGLHLGAAADPVQGQGPQEGRRRKDRPRDLPRHTTTATSTSGSASIATATTYSDNSVYSQLGTQVGPANVAQTANKMGIQTDLSTPDVQYSVNGGPFEPYNPALILGGLRTGVTPLEMAHAYQTLQHNGQIVSGTMADSSNGPVAIQKVQDSERQPGRDQQRRPRAGQGRDQAGGVARGRRDRQGDPPHRGHVRNREQRLYRRPERMGQDRDDREQRRRLVRRRHQGRHRGRLGRPRGLGDSRW